MRYTYSGDEHDFRAWCEEFLTLCCEHHQDDPQPDLDDCADLYCDGFSPMTALEAFYGY